MYTFIKIRIFELDKFIRKTAFVNTNLKLKYRGILLREEWISIFIFINIKKILDINMNLSFNLLQIQIIEIIFLIKIVKVFNYFKIESQSVTYKLNYF